MTSKTLFITGTDTGVGKTVLAGLLVRHLRARGLGVAAFKPVCSGGRDDARALHAALGGAMTLDEINPWHFRAAVSPLLAARSEKKTVKRAEVIKHARKLRKNFPVLVVEGAGGLLSPLGEDFDSRDLIKTLRAIPIVVAPNRLGAINQVLVTLAALPKALAEQARVVLMAQSKPDSTGRGNLEYLRQRLVSRVFELPWLRSPASPRTDRALAVFCRSF